MLEAVNHLLRWLTSRKAAPSSFARSESVWQLPHLHTLRTLIDKDAGHEGKDATVFNSDDEDEHERCRL